MPTVSAEALRRLTAAILERTGTPAAPAEALSASLVDANLAGHDSHGVLRMTFYIASVRRGDVDPAATPTVAKRDRATATIDARRGWGQPAMRLAAETAIGLAAEFGVGAAVVNRCFHIGRVAPYVEAIAAAGMIGIAMANTGPSVTAYGGRTTVTGTNPFAWALPRADGRPPVCLDIATAVVAEGKLRVAQSKGLAGPPGHLLDAAGDPTTNPDDFYRGGALLPFGGHKGGGLNVLAQYLGYALAGMDPTGVEEAAGANGPFALAIDIAPFTPMASFLSAVEKQSAAITASPPADGFATVRLPGDLELETRAERLAAGIPVPDPIWAELTTLAAEVGALDLVEAAVRGGGGAA